VLVTTGLRDGLPDIPGLRQRWARDVLHCPYCHGHEVRDRQLGVIGGTPGRRAPRPDRPPGDPRDALCEPQRFLPHNDLLVRVGCDVDGDVSTAVRDFKPGLPAPAATALEETSMTPIRTPRREGSSP
jgi:hypothetical protein